MIQPPSPPEKATEYLQELAQYYRELIDYHQQAAILAGQQLVHVEALLGQDTSLPVSQTKSWLLENSSSDDDHLKSQLSTEDEDYHLQDNQEIIEDSIEGDEGVELILNEETSLNFNDSNLSKNFFTKDSLPTLEELRDFFEKDRGKFLQIDYIIQYFYGQVNQSEKQEIKSMLSEKLKTGSLKHLWVQVPDAPDCWTFTLLDFPEFSDIKGDNSLASNLKGESLTTRKVAESLETIPQKIYEVRSAYSDRFIEGIDYYKTILGHYRWTENGVNKLSKFIPSPPQMLPFYQGLSMEKAITKLFQFNPGRELTINEVRDKIYGKLSQVQATSVRMKITTSLSHGHKMGLWQRVTDKIGVYRSN